MSPLQKPLRFFSVSLPAVRADDVRGFCERWLNEPAAGHQVVTVNPEMLVASRTDEPLRRAIEHADLCLVDGFGIQLTALVLKQRRLPRLTGSELVSILFEKTNHKRQRVLLMGGKGDVSRRAMLALKTQYPHIIFEAEPAPAVSREEGHWVLETGFLERVRRFAPDVLLVSLGHGKQESWIHDHLPLLPSVKIAVGVGGVFAFIAGDVPRAPLRWQRWGIEWLWRLIQEPRRIKRILTAVVVFPVLVVWDRIRGSNQT